MEEKLVITVKEAHQISGVDVCQIRAWVKNGTWSGIAYKGTGQRHYIGIYLIPLCEKLGLTVEEAREKMKKPPTGIGS